MPPGRLAQARAFATSWHDTVTSLFNGVQLLALPTVRFFPLALARAGEYHYTRLTLPFNVAGLPALALPVPLAGGHRMPASLQLIGPPVGEDLLLATGAQLEAASGYRWPG